MKHPKFTREENRACKLNDEQIEQVQMLRKQGRSYQNIADQFNMSLQGIRWWCLTEDQRKEITKNRKRQPNHNEQYDFKEYRKRKLELHPELKQYENQFTNEYKLKNRPLQKETVKKAGHNRWLNHKEKLKAKNKEYQLAHLDKFRLYNKKHREKLRNDKTN